MVDIITAIGLLGAIFAAIVLWTWLGRSLGRGHLGVERSMRHYLWEQEIRRHPY